MNGARTVSSSVSVSAGAYFEFEWYHDSRGDDIIAAVSGIHSSFSCSRRIVANLDKQSHKGPVQGKLSTDSIALGVRHAHDMVE